MVHARALLQGDERGATAYLEADVRDPGAILEHASLREVLDLSKPVGILLITTLHFVHDDEQVAAVVRHLLDAVPSGSYLVITHGTMDFSGEQGIAAYEQMFAAGRTDVRARPKRVIEQYFAGLEIVEPGIVPVGDWRPDDASGERPVSEDLQIYGVVGRKP